MYHAYLAVFYDWIFNSAVFLYILPNPLKFTGSRMEVTLCDHRKKMDMKHIKFFWLHRQYEQGFHASMHLHICPSGTSTFCPLSSCYTVITLSRKISQISSAGCMVFLGGVTLCQSHLYHSTCPVLQLYLLFSLAH